MIALYMVRHTRHPKRPGETRQYSYGFFAFGRNGHAYKQLPWLKPVNDVVAGFSSGGRWQFCLANIGKADAHCAYRGTPGAIQCPITEYENWTDQMQVLNLYNCVAICQPLVFDIESLVCHFTDKNGLFEQQLSI